MMTSALAGCVRELQYFVIAGAVCVRFVGGTVSSLYPPCLLVQNAGGMACSVPGASTTKRIFWKASQHIPRMGVCMRPIHSKRSSHLRSQAAKQCWSDFALAPKAHLEPPKVQNREPYGLTGTHHALLEATVTMSSKIEGEVFIPQGLSKQGRRAETVSSATFRQAGSRGIFPHRDGNGRAAPVGSTRGGIQSNLANIVWPRQHVLIGRSRAPQP